MSDVNEYLLPLKEGPLELSLPADSGRTIYIPGATRIPTGPDQTAISVTFPHVESSYSCSVIIENQVLQPGNGHSWRHGIYLENAWYAKLNNIHIVGPAGPLASPAMENGIILNGRSNSVSIQAYHAMGLTTALLIAGKSEATRLVNYEFISCYHGVAALTDQFCPGLQVSHGHIRASSAAFMLRNQCQFTISDCVVYGDNGFPAIQNYPFYTALLLEGCFDGSVNDVKVGCMSPGKPMVQPLVHGGERIAQKNVERLPF